MCVCLCMCVWGVCVTLVTWKPLSLDRWPPPSPAPCAPRSRKVSFLKWEVRLVGHGVVGDKNGT